MRDTLRAHPAGAQTGLDNIWSEFQPWRKSILNAALLRTGHSGGLPHYRLVQKTLTKRAGGEERFHLTPKIFVLLTDYGQVACSLSRLTLSSGVVQLFNLAEAFRSHRLLVVIYSTIRRTSLTGNFAKDRRSTSDARRLQANVNQIDIFLRKKKALAAHLVEVPIVPSSLHDASSRMPVDSFEHVRNLVNKHIRYDRRYAVAIKSFRAVDEHYNGALIWQ